MVDDQKKSDVAPKSSRQPIKGWPTSERPREKLLQLGPEGLSDGELLAVLLRIGKAGQAAEILNTIKSEIIAILRDAGVPL